VRPGAARGPHMAAQACMAPGCGLAVHATPPCAPCGTLRRRAVDARDPASCAAEFCDLFSLETAVQEQRLHHNLVRKRSLSQC